MMAVEGMSRVSEGRLRPRHRGLIALGVFAIGLPVVVLWRGASVAEPLASYLVLNGKSKTFDVLLFALVLTLLFAVGCWAGDRSSRARDAGTVSHCGLRGRSRPSLGSVFTTLVSMSLAPIVIAGADFRVAGLAEILVWIGLLGAFALYARAWCAGGGSLGGTPLSFCLPRHLIGAACGSVGVALVLTRVGIRWSPLGALLLVLACNLMFLLAARRFEMTNRGRQRVQEWATWGCELLSLTMPLTLWPTADGGLEIFPRAKVALVLLIAGLFLLHFLARPRLAMCQWQPSLAMVISFAIFMQSPPCVGVPLLVTDDFHLGEGILPWTQYVSFGSIPYVDLAAIHGLMDFLYGAMNQFVGGGVVATSDLAFSWQGALLGALLALLNSKAIGRWRTLFLAAFPVFEGHVWPILFAFPTIVLLARLPLTWCRTLGLMAFACFALAWNVSLGVGVVMGVGFVILESAWRSPAFLKNALNNLTLPAAICAGAVAAFLGWDMIMGFVTFMLENGRSSLLAHGIPLRFNKLPFQGFVWSWLAAFVMVIAFASRVRSGIHRASLRAWGARSLLAFLVIGIPWWGVWAIGRIDPGQFSRPGLVSLAIVPSVGVFFNPLMKRRGLWALAVAVAFLACLASLRTRDWGTFTPSGSVISVKADSSAIRLKVEALKRPDSQWVFVDGLQSGLPGLGKIWIQRERAEELIHFQDAIRQLIPAGTPWIDFTNAQARYQYLGDRAPCLYPALFNAVGRAQQLRVIAQFEQQSPAIIDVTRNDALAFDGFVSSLRSRLVVEWCLDRYEPVQIGKFSFLVRPDFAPEIGRVVASEQAGWYSRAFDNGIRGENRDLGFLPGVWGASGPVVRSFVAEVSLPTKGLLGSPGNSWIVQIPDRSASSFGDVLLLEWDSAGSAPGSQGGIRVVLAFHDKDGCAALNITAKSFCNRMLIPVGTFGRWFAGDRLLNFTADFQPNSGQSFSSVQGGFTNLRASLGRFQ